MSTAVTVRPLPAHMALPVQLRVPKPPVWGTLKGRVEAEAPAERCHPGTGSCSPALFPAAWWQDGAPPRPEGLPLLVRLCRVSNLTSGLTCYPLRWPPRRPPDFAVAGSCPLAAEPERSCGNAGDVGISPTMTRLRFEGKGECARALLVWPHSDPQRGSHVDTELMGV